MVHLNKTLFSKACGAPALVHGLQISRPLAKTTILFVLRILWEVKLVIPLANSSAEAESWEWPLSSAWCLEDWLVRGDWPVWLISTPRGLQGTSSSFLPCRSQGSKGSQPRVPVLVKPLPLSCWLVSCWPKQASWPSPSEGGEDSRAPLQR